MPFSADPSMWPNVSKAKIALWRKLHTHKGRRETGQLVVEGVRLVGEALLSGCPVEVLLAMNTKEGLQAATRVLAAVPSWTGTALRVPEREFHQITDTTHAAGVAAVITWNPRVWAKTGALRADRILFCDRITDPGNLGTLIRTGAGIGVDAVLVGPDCVEVTSPKTMRASAGAVFRIPVIRVEIISEFLEWAQTHQHVVFIADVHQGEGLADNAPPPRWTLVVGGEIGAVDPAWNSVHPRHVTLPMDHGVESFNAAIAGAILMDRLCRGRAG